MAINNKVILTGNLGSEAEIIETENTTFASVSIATADTYKDDNEEWQQAATIWHNVLTFNPKLIEALKSLKTGTRVEIEGALSYRPYQVQIHDKDGVVREITKQEASIIARKIELAPLAKKDK